MRRSITVRRCTQLAGSQRTLILNMAVKYSVVANVSEAEPALIRAAASTLTLGLPISSL
jgi:hypothetical protein